MTSDPLSLLLLLAAGLVAGVINVVAGGGSFLTLPLLIFMGLPPTTANGTNRIGIVVQNAGAVWGFRRHGLVERRWIWMAAVPAAIGSIAGTLLALWMEGETFKRVLSFLMIAVTIWTLWDPMKSARGRAAGGSTARASVGLGLGFALVGIYGGFVQAGVGFFFLAVSTLAGYDLVKGNALKVLCILVFTPLSLALFAWQGQVAWLPGLVLAAGTFVGGQAGVHLTVLKGHRWIRAVVSVVVVLLAIQLWLEG